jgi:hypothetical protein
MRRLLLALLLATACSGGGGGPAISNMTYSPTSAPVSTNTAFDITMDFDPSVDITTIEFSLVNSPAGPTKTPQDFPITGAQGIHNGTLNATLQVQFSSVGTYEFGLDVLDANQKRSNQLTGIITVQ